MQVINGFPRKNPDAIHNSICMVRSVRRATVNEKKSAVFCPMSATSFSTDATWYWTARLTGLVSIVLTMKCSASLWKPVWHIQRARLLRWNIWKTTLTKMWISQKSTAILTSLATISTKSYRTSACAIQQNCSVEISVCYSWCHHTLLWSGLWGRLAQDRLF